MTLPGPDRYDVQEPCAVCDRPATSNASSTCHAHLGYRECDACLEYTQDVRFYNAAEAQLCASCANQPQE